MAEGYDDSFTRGAVGRLMREAVWRRLDALFAPGQRVLELGCGTGEDAAHLAARGVRVLATDVSGGMLEVTRAKIARLGLETMVEVRRLDIAALARPSALSPQPPALFDGALANFGGLNCVADLAGVAAGLARLLRPGAPVALCVMGPAVPWEWGWFLRRGEARKALRRLAPGGAAWRGLTITYPRVGALIKAFAPWFSPRRVAAVGALLPPSYAEPWASAHPAALWALHRLERRFETLPPLPRLADHYLLELERG
ncbi:MAG TPA: class I SAM-dependent methyltransferase [Chloroflexaceae bacterium]|nr:class I SAM-dependent methyltransferase [Chloroflexaceae bacterium]